MKSRFHDEIAAETSARLDTEFLNHLSRGTTGYRSLYNLTHEVGNQYRGRFLVELLQNAHDALLAARSFGTRSRVKFALRPDEGEFGVLYVANDGVSFTRSNFLSLSQLAQSDKTPESSIGNKGIGFRSVLEISATPQVFSRPPSGGLSFCGYCFGFDPGFIAGLEKPILRLADGDRQVLSPVDAARPLVDWDQGHLDSFSRRMKGNACELEKELHYLSPYLFPLPLTAEDFPGVAAFENEGYATVIRLPLKDAAAAQSVRHKLSDFSATTVLFLDRLTQLILDSGTEQRTITRRTRRSAALPDTHLVAIRDTDETSRRRYGLCQERLNLADNLSLKESLVELPEQWHGLREVTVSLAVSLEAVPEQGFFSVFLPTLQTSGCGAYINAPFYAKLDRTGLNFDYRYNAALLHRVALLALRVTRENLTGGGVTAARAVVDMLAPWPDAIASRWYSELQGAAKEMEFDLADLPLFATDRGWQPPTEASLIPLREGMTVLNQRVLREFAQFPAIVEDLDSRRPQIVALCSRLFEHLKELAAEPLVDDLAATVEAAAFSLLAKEGSTADWNGFWRDLMVILPGTTKECCDELKKRQFVLGNDGELHAGGSEGCKIFFLPVIGVDDEEMDEGAVQDIPATLRESVAFVHESIRLYEDRRALTPVRKFLQEKDLVNRYRVEDVFKEVLIPSTPSLPVPLQGHHGDLCKDILFWGLRLVEGMKDRTRTDSIIRYVKMLPVPCRGGWYQLKDASFGSGWQKTSGSDLVAYLRETGTSACLEALQRVLLPPSSGRWRGDGERHGQLLLRAGVFDGLRTASVAPDEWSSSIGATRYSFTLPEAPPPTVSPTVWKSLGKHASAAAARDLRYESYFNYQAQTFSTIPGLDAFDVMQDTTREHLMKLLMISIPQWGSDWDKLVIKKKDGWDDRLIIPSPLKVALQQFPWLGVFGQGGWSWRRPSDCWLVPSALLAGRNAWHYSHLQPLPWQVAERLEKDPALEQALSALGLPKYDPGRPMSDARLLESLAVAICGGHAELPVSILVGQVREAWKMFDPADGSRFPRQVVYRRGANHSLEVAEPSEDFPLYLPDSPAVRTALEMNSLPVVEIKPYEAGRLRDRFSSAYGNRIRLASRLTLQPIVDNHPWQNQDAALLTAGELDWLSPVLLTLVAHWGDNAQGSTTRTFAECLEVLREAKVCWVPTLELGLFSGEERIETNLPLPSFWLEKEKVLLLTDECRRSLFLASEALAKLVDREDLKLPIRMFLKEIPDVQPGLDAIQAALAHIEMDRDIYLYTLEQWRVGQGVGQIVQLLVPAVMSLDGNAKLDDLALVDTEDKLATWLSERDLAPVSAQELLETAHGNLNSWSFGVALFDRVGGTVQLDRINSARKLLSLPALENREASFEFRSSLADAYLPLHCMIAALAARKAHLGGYAALAGKFAQLSCPDDFRQKYWRVDFSHVMATSEHLFRGWGASEEECSVFASPSAEELADALSAIGIATGEDPRVIGSHNRSKVKETMAVLGKVGIAWSLKNGGDLGEWTAKLAAFAEHLEDEIEVNGHLNRWRDARIFATLKALTSRLPGDDQLVSVLVASDDLDDFILRVGLTSDDLANSLQRYEEQKELERKIRRRIDVCGSPFDPSEENLEDLWGHICDSLGEDAIAQLPSLNIKQTGNLKKMTSKPVAKKREGRSPNGKARSARDAAKDNLVGLAGEIHVYRMLEHTYGKGVVNPGCWVSGNSQHVFKDNPCDDGAGYDFYFRLEGKTYHLEVKASQGDDNSFRLGSSEFEFARKLAGRQNKKGIFQIIHVKDALSTCPTFTVLPNPFVEKYRSQFDLSDAEVWVRYRQ